MTFCFLTFCGHRSAFPVYSGRSGAVRRLGPSLWPSSWHFGAISDQMECLAFEDDSIPGLVPCQHRILALLRAAADTLAALKDACLAMTFRH